MTKSTRELPALAAAPAVGGEIMRDKLAELQNAGVKSLTINQVVGLLGFAETEAAVAQPASPLRGRDMLREALQHAYDFLQDKCFTPDALTHECTKVLEQMEAALASPPEQPAADPVTNESGWPPQFELMKLQARPPEGGDWTDIFPAQLYSMAKRNDVRAIEQTYPTADKETK